MIISTGEAICIFKDKILFLRNASNGEFIFRCPFCGDSDNLRHGHLYINQILGIFNCYICEMAGNLNKLLYIFLGDKFKVDMPALAAKKVPNEEEIKDTQNFFEIYLQSCQAKVSFNDVFDILKTIETQPIYLQKHAYFCRRVLKNPLLISLINETNTTQNLFTYYSEYFMLKFLELEPELINGKSFDFIKEYILSRCSSLQFLGYHKTLNIFKNDSLDTKYFKMKKNIFYGKSMQTDFFLIINQNKFQKNLSDLYKERELNVYFAEGVFDALNLYLYNPKYVTGIEPDIIVSTGSKVSFGSALYFIRDTFFKPIVSHIFLDPDIRYKEFFKKYKLLHRIYSKVIVYQNGNFDYGDISQDDLAKIKICDRLG